MEGKSYLILTGGLADVRVVPKKKTKSGEWGERVMGEVTGS